MNRYFWLASGCVVVLGASIGAIWFLDVGQPRLQAELSLTFGAIGTIAGIGSAFLAYVGIRRMSQAPTPHPWPSPPTVTTRRERRPPQDEDESLAIYLNQMRDRLHVLGAEPSRFIPLTTTADPSKEELEPQLIPPLEWVRRQHQQQYVDAEPAEIDLFSLTGNGEFKRAVLLGEPGSGKSTCLRQLALVELERVAQSDDAERDGLLLPFYVPLSEWRDAKVGAEEFLLHQLEALVGETSYLAVNFDVLLRKGRFLLLLDGLNELPGRKASTREGSHEQAGGVEDPVKSIRPARAGAARIDSRERSLRQLAQLIGLQSRFILSCRSYEYFDSLQWQVIRVLPMTPDQIDRFVNAYLEPDDAEGLCAMLRRNPALAEIATNPFFLRSLVAVYHPDLDRLSSRGEVLEYLYRRLLQREHEQGATDPLDEREITKAIGRIAFRMLGQRSVGNQAPLYSLGDAERPAAEALAGTGLLMVREDNFYFYHQIVQEFFAASALSHGYIRRRPATLLADKRWSEVLALWLDLEQQRFQPRLIRGLRAHNLPWRRPPSPPSWLLGWYGLVTGVAAFVVVSAYLLDWVLWPLRALASPLELPLAPIALVAIAMAVRIPWFYLVRHRYVITNSAYVLTVGRNRPPEAVPAIIRALVRIPEREQIQVAQSLGRFGQLATGHAVNGLRSRRWRMRAGCVFTLGEIARQGDADDPRIVEALLAVANAAEPKLRRPLITALGSCHDKRIPSAVVRLIEQASNPMTVVFQLQPLDQWTAGTGWSQEVLDRFDPLLAPEMAEPSRAAALRAIGTLRLPGGHERLAAIAGNPRESPVVRASAMIGLGRLQSEEAVEKLVALAEADPRLVNDMAKAIRSTFDPATLPALVRAAAKPSWKLREAVAVALGRVGGAEVLPTLGVLAVDPDEDVRAAAARALGAASLSQGPPPELLSLMRDKDAKVRTAAIDAIIESFADLAAPILANLAADPAYQGRGRVIRLLGHHANPAVVDTLRSLRGDPDRSIREEARVALARIEAAVTQRAAHPDRRVWRSPVRWLKSYVAGKLQVEGLQAMLREERMDGTSNNELIAKVQARIFNDAELARRYRFAMRVVYSMFIAACALAGAVGIVLLRLALWASVGLVSHWRLLAALLLLAGASFLPGIRAGRQVRILGNLWLLVRSSAVAVLALLLVGGVVYIWWILVLVAAVALAGGYVYTVWRRARRRRLIARSLTARS